MGEDYGFSFGFDYNALFQAASDSLGEDTAAGGVFRAYGSWTLVGKDSGDTGTLVYKVENRHRLGTDIAPKDLGAEVGYAGLTAVTFSDIGWALTNLYWSQRLLKNRLAFVTGIVDTTDYVDVYGLVNIWTDFSNYAFTTDPTIPAPNQGLGAAVWVMPTENIYILGGIADANGDPTDTGEQRSIRFSTTPNSSPTSRSAGYPPGTGGFPTISTSPPGTRTSASRPGSPMAGGWPSLSAACLQTPGSRLCASDMLKTAVRCGNAWSAPASVTTPAKERHAGRGAELEPALRIHLRPWPRRPVHGGTVLPFSVV